MEKKSSREVCKGLQTAHLSVNGQLLLCAFNSPDTIARPRAIFLGYKEMIFCRARSIDLTSGDGSQIACAGYALVRKLQATSDAVFRRLLLHLSTHMFSCSISCQTHDHKRLLFSERPLHLPETNLLLGRPRCDRPLSVLYHDSRGGDFAIRRLHVNCLGVSLI